MTDYGRITVIESFDDLRHALRLRKADLGLSHLEIDDIAGLQQGYTGKIMCGVKRPGDMSLPALLGALKCRLVLVHAKACEQSASNDITMASADNLKKLLSARAKRGVKKRMEKLSLEQRRAIARKASKTRWARARAKKRLEVEASKAKKAEPEGCVTS